MGLLKSVFIPFGALGLLASVCSCTGTTSGGAASNDSIDENADTSGAGSALDSERSSGPGNGVPLPGGLNQAQGNGDASGQGVNSTRIGAVPTTQDSTSGLGGCKDNAGNPIPCGELMFYQRQYYDEDIRQDAAQEVLGQDALQIQPGLIHAGE